MNDLIKFRIPSAFVLERLLPTPSEILYGFEHGWIVEPDLVELSLAVYEAGGDVPKVIENLALLLSDEFSRIPDLLEEFRSSATDDAVNARVWLFLALSWIRENKGSFVDPYEAVEMLYADFEYPSEIEGLVRFMPAPVGEPVGLSALDARWQAYLSSESDWFRARTGTGRQL